MTETTVPIRIRKTAKDRLARLAKRDRRSMVETLDILLETAENLEVNHD